jgi:pimeloyl-ACP methyl ester carboxylesterase
VVRAVIAAAVLGVAFVALNTWLVERATGPARADIGRIVELPQGDVQVREDGDRSKPAIVLLHGFGCSLRWWDRVVPALARELRVVRIDLLGHGGSEKPRDGYSMENQADLVAGVIERLGLRRPAVTGHSMGGVVATALAERHPDAVARVMMIGTPPDGEDQDVPITARAVTWPVTGHLVDTFIDDRLVRNVVEQGFDPRFDIPERLIDDLFGRTTYSAFNGSSDGIRDYWDEKPLPERWSEVDVPLTVVVGQRERHTNRSVQLYNSVPDARTVVMQGLDHTPQVEAPDRTAPLLLAFALE